MVIHEIDVRGFSVLESENHPPIGADDNRPKSFKVAFQRMEAKSRQIEVRHALRSFKQG